MKRFAGIILGVATLLAGSALSAEVFHVDRDFKGEKPAGDSWFSAFSSVQEAIDAATAKGGGEIWVKAGVYKPSGETRDATFQLKPGIELYGGFRGNETLRAQRNTRANRTVFSGDIGRIGSFADNCHHVVTGAAGSRIDGFIVSAGNADGKDGQGGGALLLESDAADFTAANCTFEKNHAATGGAIHTVAGGTTLSNCTFYANSADFGGAIHIGNGAGVQAMECRFSSNFAKLSGGAIAIDPTSKVGISRSWFLLNHTDGTGGAMAGTTKQKRGIELALEKCEFIENSATENGGTLFHRGAFFPVLSHCRFAKNVSVQGAAVMANRDGAIVALMEETLIRNRSAEGFAEIDSDTTSKVFSDVSAVQRAEKPKPAIQPEPKRPLPDVYIHDASNAKVKLRNIIAESNYTVLSTGDLTAPEFIASYRNIEAAARDYSKKGVDFFYIYCFLAHPENHGYVQPITLEERTRHIMDAKRLLRTRIPWLCDGMGNEVAKALGRKKNNLFIFNKEGLEEYAGNMVDADAFRKTLAGLAGRVESPTPPRLFTPPDIAPVDLLEARFTERVAIDPSKNKFEALRTTSVKSRTPYYVKVRAEANKKLLKTGNGRMYLGFHIDPLYRMEWNNLGKTLSYTIKVPRGTAISPSRNQSEKIEEVAIDSEPREFLLNVRKWDSSDPVAVTVNYSIHSARSKRTFDISQRYILYLESDPFGGTVIGRQVSESGR